jgi:hypothetical protein
MLWPGPSYLCVFLSITNNKQYETSISDPTSQNTFSQMGMNITLSRCLNITVRALIRNVYIRDEIKRGFINCTFQKYYSGDQIKKKRTGCTYSMYGEKIGAYRVLVGKTEERVYFYHLGVGGRIILKWISKKCDRAWTELIRLRIRTDGRLF